MKLLTLKNTALALSMVLTLGISMAFATDFVAKEGKIDTKTFGNVKLHDYMSKTGAHSQVVENDKLVIFDVFGNVAGNNDFKAFIDSLGKPIEKVIITHRDEHHWIGIDTLFPNTEFFSVDADAINTDGAKMLEEAKAQDSTIPFTTVPKVTKLPEGKSTIDGVEYVFTSYPFQAWTIEMPAQKVAFVHHLGYVGVHLPMPPMDQRLAALKKLEADGVTWITGGHGLATDAENFVKTVEGYFAFVQKAVADSKTPEEAKEKIIAQYPNFAAPFFLDMLLPDMMKK